MILREILVTRKLGVKQVGGEKWYGGHPVFPAPNPGSVILRQSGFIGESYDYKYDSGNSKSVGGILIDDPAGQVKAAFGGEYDLRDFLFFTQPVVTTKPKLDGNNSITDKPIGLAFHSYKVRPTEVGLPDGKDYITVIFFPCIVTISLDASEAEEFGEALPSGGNLPYPYVHIEAVLTNNNNLAYVKYDFSSSLEGAIGAVLGADPVNRIYTIEFWG